MTSLPRRAAFAALMVICLLQLACLLRAPAAWSPRQVSLRLPPGASLPLGSRELAAPAAGPMEVGRSADGRWWVRTASATQPLRLWHGGQSHATGTTRLAAGTRFQLGATAFAVTAAGAGAVELSDGRYRWRYDGARVSRNGVIQPPCPGARWSARLLWRWNRFAPSLLALPRPLAPGGNLDCGNRLGIEGIALGSASISIDKDGAWLAAGGDAPLLLGGETDLATRAEALDGATALTAGRTRFTVSIANGVLALRPTSHVALLDRPQAELPPQVDWSWGRRDLWQLAPASGVLAYAALCVALAGMLGWRAMARGRRLRTFAAGAAGPLIALAGAGALVSQRLGTSPGTGWLLLLAWAALWYAVLAPRRFGAVAAIATLLLAAGLLAQLELGLGAPESSWLRHVDKTAAICAFGLGLGVWLALPGVPVPRSRRRFELALLGCAALALVALALQVAFGSETGVFELQPVEFAKLALAALCAYCLALGARDGALLAWLRLLAPAALFLSVLGVALVQVDDYSPLVLLTVWAGAMALAWALALRRRAASLVLAGAACAAVFSVAGLRSAGAEEAQQLSFYADRFQVWLDPAAHPHTGRQLLLGARAIADGGWLGADGLLGLASLGQPAGDVLRVPEIQDDFAPSFFANRHGLLGVLALWLLQAGLVTALLRTAARAWIAGEAMRDYRNAWHARFRCFALCGGAAFLFGHFLLSWGTNLAIFPVMGQPMSFLSAGGSHLLIFICPLLAFGIASDQT